MARIAQLVLCVSTAVAAADLPQFRGRQPASRVEDCDTAELQQASSSSPCTMQSHEHQTGIRPIANLTSGSIRGSVVSDVAGFQGVPYAKPPIGPLRFASPEPPDSWGPDIRDATRPANACVQFVDWYGVPPENQSENCLYLDVFAPVRALGRDALLPIWVYFHGGSFAGGQAGATWSIPQLVGVVVVAPQYRLGAFGFYAPEVPPPNFGIQDQRLALRWVQENARAFGGDPQRVMIMGNSAGSASVAGHLVMPESFGLYSSASMESPGGHQGWMGEGQRINDDWTSTSILLKNSVQLAKECGCGSSEDLTCMQAVPIDELMKNAKPMRFAPALGSEGEYPLSLMREGKYHQVPIIVGGTNCESCANAETSLGKYTDSITQQEYDDAVQKWVQGAGSGASITVEELTDWYAGDCAQYGYWRCFAQMDGESGHTCSAALTAEALRTTSSTVWRYLFTEKDPAKDFPGASHASEGSYLFGAGHPMPGASPAQDSLSRDMAFWWMSLAAHGDPNAASASKVTWTAYTEEDAQVMFLSDDPHMGTSAATATPGCEHWKPYLGWGED